MVAKSCIESLFEGYKKIPDLYHKKLLWMSIEDLSHTAWILGSVEGIDKNRAASMRSCIEVDASENITNFLENMGFQFDYETILRGTFPIDYSKYFVRISLSQSICLFIFHCVCLCLYSLGSLCRIWSLCLPPSLSFSLPLPLSVSMSLSLSISVCLLVSISFFAVSIQRIENRLVLLETFETKYPRVD